MSSEITTAFVQQYKAGIIHLAQQRFSKLRQYCRLETQTSKADYYDRIGATTIRKRTVRHGDSPFIETPHSRRQLTMEDFDWGDFVDKEDLIRTLNDPTNPYVEAAAMAMARETDQIIYDSFTAAVNTGETGATSLAFAAAGEGGTIIVSGGTNLDMDKILEVKETFDDAEVDDMLERVLVVTPDQIKFLLKSTDVKSHDFNTVKALALGQINQFAGFTFQPLSKNIVAKTGDDRECIAFIRNKQILAEGQSATGRISERADKGYSTYAFMRMTAGALRLEGEMVIRVDCDEIDTDPND